MKKISIAIFFSVLAISTLSQDQKPEDTEDWSRIPKVVTPGKGTNAPSDAILLYGCPACSEKWESVKGGPIGWKAEEVLTIDPTTEGIRTKKAFGNVQLHIEWRAPEVIEGKGQKRGNSGIYFMGEYEVQVLDSYENVTYPNGQAASIYKQHIPLVNACRPPGEWQTYDIIFTAPRFKGNGDLESPAYFTVIHNGILVQNHVELTGPTENIGKPTYKAHPEKMPLMLQEHNDPVSFRNIWIREL